MQKTKFNMFVNIEDKDRLISVLRIINADSYFSESRGLDHFVRFELGTVKGDKQWFKIEVSRPFLIFKIGEKYAKTK